MIARILEFRNVIQARVMARKDANPSQAERQRQATRPGLVVRGTFSPARAWRPAVVARLTRTFGLTEDAG